MEKVLFNWSGGKDSSLCLYKLINSREYEICSLLTTVNEEKGRVSMHGIREELLRNQASEIALPLNCIMLPDKIDMEEYNRIMTNSLQLYREKGIRCSVFGDIFLENLRSYREEKLHEAGMKAIFPLWKKSTDKLAYEFIDLGFKAIISSIDGNKLDKSFVGREYDQQFLQDLPENVDPCGEYGEFHTFVYDGPIFDNPVSLKKGKVVQKIYEDRQDQTHSFTDDADNNSSSTSAYWFIDLIPS